MRTIASTINSIINSKYMTEPIPEKAPATTPQETTVPVTPPIRIRKDILLITGLIILIGILTFVGVVLYQKHNRDAVKKIDAINQEAVKLLEAGKYKDAANKAL